MVVIHTVKIIFFSYKTEKTTSVGSRTVVFNLCLSQISFFLLFMLYTDVLKSDHFSDSGYFLWSSLTLKCLLLVSLSYNFFFCLSQRRIYLLNSRGYLFVSFTQ